MGYLENKELLSRTLQVPHIYGLPISEDTQCDLCYLDDGFVVIGSGMTFNLSYDVVTEVTIKTDVEIQKQYVSSVGGAVGGAILFGPVGALIGGRVKEKTAYLKG